MLYPQKYADEYGDTLEVEFIEASGNVCLTSLDSDGEVAVVFTPEVAINIARAIYAAAGKDVVDISEIPSAHNVTFNEAMLRVAAIHKRTVCFRYQKVKGGYIESRRLNPEAIVGEGETLGVSGKDPDRDAPRRFRLSQIQGEVSFA